MSTESQPAKQAYFYGIDLLRFFCALMVTLFHLGFASWASPLFPNAPYRLTEVEYLFQPGWVGVQIFFVISGFVIVGAAQAASTASFVKGRIIRLYPAVWVCATVTFVARLLAGTHPHVASYMKSMLLVPVGPWIDGQYWTLAVEIAFYLLVALFIIARQAHQLIYLALGLAVSSFVFNLLLIASPNDLLFAFTQAPLKTLPVDTGCHFALGMILYYWSRGPLGVFRLSIGLLAAAAGAMQVYHSSLGGNDRIAAATGHDFPSWPALLVWAVGVAVIVASIAGRSAFTRLPARTLAFIRTLGLMTYPLYLIHFFVGVMMMNVAVRAGAPPYVALTGTVALVCLASWIVSARLEPKIKRPLRAGLDWAERRLALGDATPAPRTLTPSATADQPAR